MPDSILRVLPLSPGPPVAGAAARAASDQAATGRRGVDPSILQWPAPSLPY